MSASGSSVQFSVWLNWQGMVSFQRDWGCGQAAMLAICRAIVAGRASVRDVTPAEVDELAESRSVDDPYWEDRTIEFSARQRLGGRIEVERECGCRPRDVVDLCESLLDEPYLYELDNTHFHRHLELAG